MYLCFNLLGGQVCWRLEHKTDRMRWRCSWSILLVVLSIDVLLYHAYHHEQYWNQKSTECTRQMYHLVKSSKSKKLGWILLQYTEILSVIPVLLPFLLFAIPLYSFLQLSLKWHSLFFFFFCLRHGCDSLVVILQPCTFVLLVLTAHVRHMTNETHSLNKVINIIDFKMADWNLQYCV